MDGREAKLALGLVAGAVVLGGIGIVLGIGARGGSPGDGARRDAPPRDAGLAERVLRLEGQVEGIRESLARLGRSGGGRSSSLEPSGAARRGEAGGGAPEEGGAAGAGAPAVDAGALEAALSKGGWLASEDAREALREAVAGEAERARDARKLERAERRDRQLDALAESVGLTPYERDGIADLLAATRAQQLDLEGRARELLLEPGPLTDEMRQGVRRLAEERKAILSERDGRLRDLVGEDKFRAMRKYERDQDRKLDLFDSLTDWMRHPETGRRPAARKGKAKPKGKKQKR